MMFTLLVDTMEFPWQPISRTISCKCQRALMKRFPEEEARVGGGQLASIFRTKEGKGIADPREKGSIKSSGFCRQLTNGNRGPLSRRSCTQERMEKREREPIEDSFSASFLLECLRESLGFVFCSPTVQSSFSLSLS